MAEFLVCTGSRVLLPEATDPVPATVIVNKSTGKIIDVRRNQIPREHLSFESVEYIEAGDNIVLPGLVEYALLSSHIRHLTVKYQSSCPP
jgi:allantoinase